MKLRNKLIEIIESKYFENMYKIVAQSITTISMFLTALWFDKLLEFGFLVLGYGLGKAAFGTTRHAMSFSKCTLYACLVFGVACAIVPTTQQSLFTQIILGVEIAYYLSPEIQGGDE
jgi:hypothetical protein